MRLTYTSVSCLPQSIVPGQKTTCTAKVVDVKLSGTLPSGNVIFTTGAFGGFGTFSTKAKCKLSSLGSCPVTFVPGDNTAGTVPMDATYRGDKIHSTSIGTNAIYVTGSG